MATFQFDFSDAQIMNFAQICAKRQELNNLGVNIE